MQSACDHNKTQIIARRDGVDYVECLDCRQIFEAEDLEPVKVEDDDEYAPASRPRRQQGRKSVADRSLTVAARKRPITEPRPLGSGVG